MNYPVIVAAAALFDAERRVLMQCRPAGKSMAGLWEFPGGKIEPRETPEAGLCRELHEELGIAVDPAALVPLAFNTAQVEGRPLLLLLYRCTAWRGEPRPLHAEALQWVAPAALAGLAMPPADLPFIAVLESAV